MSAKTRKKLRPMEVKPMPPRHGRWRAATVRAWESWFTSGKAALLDDVGMANLERWITLVDKADAAGWPLGLTREVRLQEAAIMRACADAAMAAEGTSSDNEAKALTRESVRERHVGRREAALDGLDHACWPGYEPGELAHTTQGALRTFVAAR